MFKNKKYVLIIFTIIIIVVIILVLVINNQNRHHVIEENSDTVSKEFNNIQDQNIINDKKDLEVVQDNQNIEQLKEEYKIIGDNELYQVEKEFDGREVLNIKPSINYKVAFAGMINPDIYELNQINNIFNDNHPKKNGIWINKNSREEMINYLNNNDILKANYSIDELGYLIQEKENELSTNDKLLGKLINSDKQVIICISSRCHMIDVVTGNVIEYRYNDLDSYQTYEYFEDENRIIIFISENTENKLKNEEIFDSLFKLFDSI